jgi:sensor c-di-GMP phosphodiesterase-like protein
LLSDTILNVKGNGRRIASEFQGTLVSLDRLLSIARNVLALVVPIVASVFLAYQVSLHDQRGRALVMADIVLNRSEQTADQLTAAFARLEAFDTGHPCSPGSVTLMRQLALGSSLLQGLGFVENDKLLCSSLGETDAVELGSPDYISATGAIIRRQRILLIAPGTPLLLVTGKMGYSGLVHPGLIFSLTSENSDLPLGTVNFSRHQTIIYSGSRTYDWSKVEMPADQHSGTLFAGGELLAWQRSTRFDQFGYAAIPLSAVWAEFNAMIAYFLAAGVLFGVGALWLVRQLAASRTSLPAMLKAGLARKEIHTVYQPIVDMRTGRWIGAEVLARWQRPTGEWISPDVFVPIAEKHGLIRHLTRFVMIRAAEDLKAFVGMAPDFFISVNITSMDLQDPGFVKQLVAECDAREVAHHRVHLEITERAEVDPVSEGKNIQVLREQGFEVGIDDFGIGYSNLAYLDTLQVDYLKIDKAFVAGISNGAMGTAVLDHIIALARERGLKVIAEGVEVEQQRAELVSRGVWLAQGWLFAKAMPAAALLNNYAANQHAVVELPISRVG